MKRQNIALQLVLVAIFIPLVTIAQTREDFQKAKEFYEVGNSVINRGDFQTAIENYSKAINLYPYVPEFFFNRAIAYRQIREYDPAIKDFDKVLELNPNLPISFWAELYYARGTVLQEKGDYTAALEDLIKAISLNSTNANYFNSRANTYVFLKKDELAIQDFNKSLELKPQSVTFYKPSSFACRKARVQQSNRRLHQGS